MTKQGGNGVVKLFEWKQRFGAFTSATPWAPRDYWLTNEKHVSIFAYARRLVVE